MFDGMTSQLEVIFGELGISQYLHNFIDQGFDTWDTILDITESDLDTLGVKLGHRRKLQRRIANSRGVAPDAALISPTRQSTEEGRQDGPKSEASKAEGPAAAVVKRKYRRHPKPDEDAPERPPSAYVLFSNKMREDLKDRNLTFTEIAKLVGDNWQNLSPGEKEPFETQAQKAKDKYTRALAEYKKTPEYRKYMVYLAEFKAKHSGQAHDKDASKRVKMTGSGAGSPSSGSTPRRGRSSTHSGSEDGLSRDTILGRKHRGSSATDTRSVLTDTHMPDARLKESPSSHSVGPQHAWADSQSDDKTVKSPRALPRFSDMFDDGPPGGPVVPYARADSTSATPGSVSSVMSTPGLVGGHFKPPQLTKQYSSTDSSASSVSYPRTPLDNPLPIHALLTGKPGQQGFELPPPPSAAPYGHAGPAKPPNHLQPTSPSFPFPCDRSGPTPTPDGFFPPGHGPPPQARTEEHQPMSPQRLSGGLPPGPGLPPIPQDAHRQSLPSVRNPGSNQGNLNGIDALLQARDIVDRRGH